jgi:hypothetical protein
MTSGAAVKLYPHKAAVVFKASSELLRNPSPKI